MQSLRLSREQSCPACEGGRAGFDIHAHYYPQAYLDLIEAEGGPFGSRFEHTPAGPKLQVGPLFAGPVRSKFICVEERLAAMDEQGVAAQALSLTQPMVYWCPPPLAQRLSAAFNDAAVRCHEAHPDRLFGFAMLPMQCAKTALHELERVAAMPGIRGVYMSTFIAGKNVSDAAFWPVFERIEALGLPIFLHPVEVIGMQDRLSAYFLSNLLGNPFDTAIAAAHLILDGVLDRFPDLQVVLPHGGGALPFLIGRIEHGWRVRPECAHLKRSPRDYLPRFHYDTITHSPEALQYLIDLVGSDRVLLGSDYCFDMGLERPLAVLDEHPLLTDAQRADISFGNAARLLTPSSVIPAEAMALGD